MHVTAKVKDSKIAITVPSEWEGKELDVNYELKELKNGEESVSAMLRKTCGEIPLPLKGYAFNRNEIHER